MDPTDDDQSPTKKVKYDVDQEISVFEKYLSSKEEIFGLSGVESKLGKLARVDVIISDYDNKKVGPVDRHYRQYHILDGKNINNEFDVKNYRNIIFYFYTGNALLYCNVEDEYGNDCNYSKTSVVKLLCSMHPYNGIKVMCYKNGELRRTEYFNKQESMKINKYDKVIVQLCEKKNYSSEEPTKL